MGTRRLPVTEAPHTRPPPNHDPISARTLTGGNTRNDPRLPPQVSTFAEVCSKQQRIDSLAAYPAIFDLQKSTITTMSERMNILASLPQQERPSLLIIIEGTMHHMRVLWGIEKLPFSYANRNALDGRIVAFSRDIVAGNTPPTISIYEEWWDQEDRPVPTEPKADAKVSKLQPEDTSIPEAAPGAETTRLLRA